MTDAINALLKASKKYTKPLPDLRGKDGRAITAVAIDDSGNLILTFSDGLVVDAGRVRGTDGRDGVDGRSVVKALVERGRLLLAISGGDIIDAGPVIGPAGSSGADGVSVTNAYIASGKLVIKLSDGRSITAGRVQGEDGKDGRDGVGVDAANINDTGDLELRLTDGRVINAGRAKGQDGRDGITRSITMFGGGGGGGVSDHGALTGLSDDDHPQYHTDARAADWLAPILAAALTAYVPYTGATADVDLGAHYLRAQSAQLYAPDFGGTLRPAGKLAGVLDPVSPGVDSGVLNLSTYDGYAGAYVTRLTLDADGAAVTGNLDISGAVTSGAWNATPINLSTYASGTLQAAQFPALTGDVTTSAGSLSTTVVRAPAGTLTGTTLASNVVSSSLTSVGTLTSGTWNGTPIAVNFGGNGYTSYSDGQLLIGNSTGSTLTRATLTNVDNQTSITNGHGSITIGLTNGISLGSYQATTPPTGGLIMPGQLGVGTDTPASGYRASIVCASTDKNGLHIGGTLTADNGFPASQNGLVIGATFAPANPGISVTGINANISVTGNSTPTVIGVFGSVAGSGITSAYGGFFAAPSGATNNCALYADGLAIGYSDTAPPASGMVVSGVSVFGAAAASGSTQVQVTGGIISDKLGLGAAPISNGVLYVNNSASDATGPIFTTTITGQIISTGSVNIGASLALNPLYSSNSGTIDLAAGLYIDSGAAGGTLTAGYGAYIKAPVFGSTKTAAYLENLTIGYTGVTPPTEGGAVKGILLIGANTTSGSNKLQVTGGATIDSLNVTTVASGTWNASTIAVNKGGTGQTSFTDGQLLIGNSTGNTLTKATLTGGAGVTITNGSGSITVAIGQAVATSSIVQFAKVGIGTSPASPLHVIVPDETANSINSVLISKGTSSGDMELRMGVSDTNKYAWISSTEKGVQTRPLVLNGTGGGVTIGAVTNSFALDIQDAGAGGTIKAAISCFGSGAEPEFLGRRAGGTQASPTATASGITLVRVGARGYQTTTNAWATADTGHLSFTSSESFTSTAQGTYASIFVTANGSTTAAEHVRTTTTGTYFGGATNAINRVDVNGSMAIGSYAGTAAPSNGMIVSGISGFGTSSPSTNAQVNIRSTKANILLLDGTMTTKDGNNNQNCVFMNNTFAPSGGAGTCFGVISTPTFNPGGSTITSGAAFAISNNFSGTGTITTMYGLFIPNISVSGPTVSTHYTAYFGVPSGATKNISMYAANAAIGSYTNTVPPANGLIVSGQAAFGTSSPNAASALEVASTTQGVRFPNMTTTQKNAISSPPEGLVVFDSTLHKLCVRGASAWETITSV